MPMFYTPKPRQFNYRPRFYNPEKERWEALKQKYADERMAAELLAQAEQTEATVDATDTSDAELEYFQRRVRELESKQRAKERGLTWRDLFRRREMPKWNYTPRFAATEGAEEPRQSTGDHLAEFKKRGVKIKRRFDVSDPDYMKPVPATRIMLYTLLVCLLLYWILF